MRKAILSTILAALCGGSFLNAQMKDLPEDAVRPDWQSEIPRITYPDTALVHLYEKTWEIAAGRVRKGPEGMAASPYLDENCYEDQIWIWDGCFMVLFSKYAPKAYPGKETLLNYYVPIHDNIKTPLLIHLRDNPPLFAWVEQENYVFTGDSAQADLVVKQKRYLQKHYDYFNTIPKGDVNTDVSPYYNPIHRGVVKDNDGQIIGYTWTGGASGMDNTPRGRDAGGWDSIMWMDAICQQALAALNIAKLCRERGETAEAAKWQKEYERIKQVVNDRYWDEQDGFYYDISVTTGKPCRIKTPASFWAMLAEIPDSARAARMVKYLQSEQYMGGRYPWNTVSRDDKDYDGKTGNYWRGGIWLPTTYMGTKALEKYGYYALADELAERVVRLQLRTYQDYTPHTIWECYNPTANTPSTEVGRTARPDFCGWSALGPISLFIENIMGFRNANAITRTLTWDLKVENGTHGISNLKFGDVHTDLLYDAEKQRITVNANRDYDLLINGKQLHIKKGNRNYKVKRLLR